MSRCYIHNRGGREGVVGGIVVVNIPRAVHVPSVIRIVPIHRAEPISLRPNMLQIRIIRLNNQIFLRLSSSMLANNSTHRHSSESNG